MTSSLTPRVATFFDPATSTATHVADAGRGSAAAIIDSVLDFDPRSGAIAHTAADRVGDYVRAEGLWVLWHLETHIHADHLSAAPYLRSVVGGQIGIGARVVEVQEHFDKVFNLGFDGQPFDRLFQDDDVFAIGPLAVRVLAVPGHTPADVAYLIGDAAFVGDTLFAPDLGSARADFPGADARALYRSARRILELPPATRIFLCHDYPPDGREVRTMSTVAEQRAENRHLREGIDEDTFVAMRQSRDATLTLPALMLPALQVNMRAGLLPEPEGNGVAYLKIPLSAAGAANPTDLCSNAGRP